MGLPGLAWPVEHLTSEHRNLAGSASGVQTLARPRAHPELQANYFTSLSLSFLILEAPQRVVMMLEHMSASGFLTQQQARSKWAKSHCYHQHHHLHLSLKGAYFQEKKSLSAKE